MLFGLDTTNLAGVFMKGKLSSSCSSCLFILSSFCRTKLLPLPNFGGSFITSVILFPHLTLSFKDSQKACISLSLVLFLLICVCMYVLMRIEIGICKAHKRVSFCVKLFSVLVTLSWKIFYLKLLVQR